MTSAPAHLSDGLHRALAQWEARTDGEPIVGWKGRTLSIGVVAEERPAWLRIVASPAALARGTWWNGTADALALTGLPRPALIDTREWDAPGLPGWRIRAELMTRLPGRSLSSTPELLADPLLPPEYWAELSTALTALTTVRTQREATVPATLRHVIRIFFGERFPTEPTRWTIAHGDLHPGNLLAEPFGIVDWEAWGRAPEHFDLATLYVHSLAVPSIRDQLRDRFSAQLESHNGRVSLAFVCAKVLGRAVGGDYPSLIDPVHALLDELAPIPTHRPATKETP